MCSGAVAGRARASPSTAERSPRGSRGQSTRRGRPWLDVIEQQLYLAYGPAGSLGATPLWTQLVAYQVPLFDQQVRQGWGQIDLLALDAAGSDRDRAEAKEQWRVPASRGRRSGRERERRRGELAGVVGRDPRDVRTGRAVVAG